MNRHTALFLLIFASPLAGTPPTGCEQLGRTTPPVVKTHEYFLSPSGKPGLQCTKAAPCREMKDVASILTPGSVVYFADGNYEAFDLIAVKGTAAAPITLLATGKEVKIVGNELRKSISKKDNVFISYCEHITVDGFNTGQAFRAGLRVDHSNFITVRNSTFANNERWGIFSDFSDDLILENNTCYGSKKEHGIYVADSSQRPIVRGNHLFNNSRCGLHMNGDLSSGKPGVIRGARVERNIIHGNGRDGGSGINMDGVQDSVIANNLLYDNHASGIAGYQIDGGEGPKNLLIINNTIVQAADGRHVIQIGKPIGPLVLRNNILYHPTPRRAGINVDAASDVDFLDSDVNLVDRVAIDGSVVALDQWKAGHPKLEQRSTLTPELQKLFEDSGKERFGLVKGSPAKGKGINHKDVPYDLKLICRTNPPSIGALE